MGGCRVARGGSVPRANSRRDAQRCATGRHPVSYRGRAHRRHLDSGHAQTTGIPHRSSAGKTVNTILVRSMQLPFRRWSNVIPLGCLALALILTATPLLAAEIVPSKFVT